MAFVKHEACTSCGSSDGKAVYEDGGTFCFVCRKASGGDPLRRFKPVEPKAARGKDTRETSKLSDEALAWLWPYKLSAKELELFSWHPEQRRLIYRDGDFYNARCFEPGETKYVSYGAKPYRVLGTGTTLVLAEDIISSLVISRQAKAIPLFGSDIPRVVLLDRWEQAKRPPIAIFLDADKWLESARLSYSLQSMGIPASVIRNDLDPKYLSDNQIKELLYERASKEVVD